MADLDFSKSSFPAMYENTVVGPMFRPWVPVLFELVSLSDGQSVLDVACGTGIVSRMVKEKLGADAQVVGVDMSPAMLALAATLAPSVEFRLGDAQALPLNRGEFFDVVLCQQGIQFFADKPLAISEMKRALKPGGRVALAAWSPVATVPFFRQLLEVVEKHVGPVSDQRHSFGNPEPLGQLLTDGGWRDVQAETRTMRAQLPDQEFIRTNAAALVGMSTLAPSTSDDERAQIVATIVRESAPVVAQYSDGNGVAFDMSTAVAWART